MQKARRHVFQRSDRLRATGFRVFFTPLRGFFSPFPHGTGSLSVFREYLALRDGPRGFGRDFSCPALLRSSSAPSMLCAYGAFTLFGAIFQFASASIDFASRRSFNPGAAETAPVWALPSSLAATGGIDFSFFSSGYWDVSVPRVGSPSRE